MIALLAAVLYVVLVLGGIQFFRQVHRWDEQAQRMYFEEMSERETRDSAQFRGNRAKSTVPTKTSYASTRGATLASTS